MNNKKLDSTKENIGGLDEPHTSMKKEEDNKIIAPENKIFKRNDRGLFDNINYVYTDEGYVDWRAMVNPKFLVPNEDSFTKKGLPIPSSIDKLADDQLIIKLAGVREVARLRGIEKVERPISYATHNGAVASCKITFLPNFETDGASLIYEEVASATVDNCNDMGAKYAETIACNRSFVRAVKSALNIFVLSDEEFNRHSFENSNSKSIGGPVDTLKDRLKEVWSINEFKDFLSLLSKSETYSKRMDEVNNWKSFDDIPIPEIRILIGLISKSKKLKNVE
jgi:hypothetical protein